MTWTNLQSSLGTRPRVIAGPILRKVTPTSVTVWLAMRIGATVTLTVLNEQDAHVMTGSRRSVAIGANLHIVAVTAQIQPPFANLSEGIVYRYDLSFGFDGNFSCNLAVATNNAQIAYAPCTLPSFALPPSDLTLLRLIQGSCRMPHADGLDTVPLIDDLIKSTVVNAFARPHQLLLTGDQIYADDVAAIMLLMLTEASTALLGWTEVLPVPNSYAGVDTAAKLSAFMRRNLLAGIGFTSEDLDAHLMSLGEYIGMYLFVWSDVLWPPGGLPELADVRADIIAQYRVLLGVDHLPPGVLPVHMDNDIEKNRAPLVAFRQTLPAVRRVLANIPSYMIFDDHEVTDDWNMTRDFCKDVYGSPLGLRIVQNALAAYTLCQHWGNVPEDFVASTSTSAGLTLLGLLDTPNPTAVGAFQQKGADYDRSSTQMRSLLGVHEAFALDARTDHGVYHDTLSLQYNYTVEGTGHQVIFTDTRTWRSFPTNSDNATHLLTKNAQTDQFQRQILDTPNFQRQIFDTPSTLNRQLLVVVTTNAPPVQPIRSATNNDRLTNFLQHFPDIYEAWDLPSVSFDRLLVALTNKLPLDGSGRRTGAVILLSGDVRHSFASRIIYRATNRFEDTTPQPAAAVFAQLVTSSFKKQNGLTVGFHRNGYFSSPHPRVTQRMIRHAMTEGYVGWNFPPNSSNIVGFQLNDEEDPETIRLTALTTVDVTPRYTAVNLNMAPHYRYRLDYLLPTAQAIQIPPPSIPPLPTVSSTPDQRKQAARAYDAALSHYRLYNAASPPKVVGVNNFGEMRFEGATAATRKVNHIVRWWDPDSSSLKITTYSVRLDVNGPADTEFPDIKATVEP